MREPVYELLSASEHRTLYASLYKPFALVVVAASLGFGACAAKSAPEPTSPARASAASPALEDGDIPLAKRLVEEGAVLLDVRTPEEFAGGHLEGATLIPVQQLEARLGEVEQLTGGDKTKPIVVYCQSGRRSAKAKRMLLEAGYTQVTNAGGYPEIAPAW